MKWVECQPSPIQSVPTGQTISPAGPLWKRALDKVAGAVVPGFSDQQAIQQHRRTGIDPALKRADKINAEAIRVIEGKSPPTPDPNSPPKTQ